MPSEILAIAQEFWNDVSVLATAPRATASTPAAARMMPGGRTGHVDLVGFLDRQYCIEVGRQLLHLAADDSIRQLVLYCDSAGGKVAGVPELSQIVRRIAAVKPLTVFVEGWCASGALWVASGARRIVASPSSMVGSIGAFVLLLDSSAALSQSGLRVRLIRSGGSGLKGHGADGLKITDDVIAFWQRHIDAIAASFEAAIEKGRRLHGERLQRLCNGEFWLAAQAMEFGLIDDVQLAEDFYADIEARFPPERFVDLHFQAAVDKYDELVDAESKGSDDEIVREAAAKRVAAKYPTLAARASAIKEEAYERWRRDSLTRY